MTHRRVWAGGLAYDFAPDDPPLLAERDWALVQARLVDELAGAPAVPLTAPFSVRVATRGGAGAAGITVNRGAGGTFALVARPWLRFTPLTVPPNPAVTVDVEAEGFVPLRRTFAIAFDTRTVVGPAPLASDRTLFLSSTAGLRPGQVLLFGPLWMDGPPPLFWPPLAPQRVRIRSVDPGNQVTLEAGLLRGLAPGELVFPDTFSPGAPVDLPLRRAPARLAGRVVTRATTTNVSTPLINATVAVSDFWRTREAIRADPAHGAMTDPNVAARQFAVAVPSGALAERAAGATAGSVNLPAVVGDERLLEAPAVAESVEVEVDRARSLAAPPAPLANRLLRLDAGDLEAGELHTLAAVLPVGGADEPAHLDLDLPLLRDHRDGAAVARLGAPVPLPATPQALVDAAAAGDRVVFLDGVGGLTAAPLPAGEALRLAGGGAPDEFLDYAHLAVRCDAGGYFRLPPLQRMARVALTVTDGAGNPVVPPFEVDLEHGGSEQWLDVVQAV